MKRSAQLLDLISRLPSDRIHRWRTKISVPLDELIITPYSRYSRLEGEPEIKETQVTPAIYEVSEPLPSLADFKEHYAGTTYKYRVIYSEMGGWVIGKDPINLGTYKKELEYAIKQIKAGESNLREQLEDASYFSSPNDPSSRDREGLAELQYLLDNFDSIFKEDAINIIANFLVADDLVGPLGIDHDLGHKIIESKLSSLFSDSQAEQALRKDYQIHYYLPEGEKELNDSDRDFIYSKNYNQICKYILATNNIVPGSITELNLSRKDFADTLPDIMLHYNLNNESLSNLTLNGTDIYISSFKNIVMDPNDAVYLLKPKDPSGNIPHLEAYLREVFARAEKEIKHRLHNMVGKVVSLWNLADI